MTNPLAIDLYCGLGGWAEGLLAEGWDAAGFDIEQHVYGEHRYPGMLAIQDVRTLHGSQFKNAALIVASPPCQEYSYMAMPWSKAKALATDYRSGKRDVKQLTELFDTCFRIQREACEAAGRHIPLIVENVRGAIPWVGRSRWNFGSFHLWGDVPALMPPINRTALKAGVAHRPDGATNFHRDLNNGKKVPGFRFDGSGRPFQTASVETTGRKSQGMNWSDRSKKGQDFTRIAGQQNGAASAGRKFASAMIAKIPLPLSRHIAATFACQR